MCSAVSHAACYNLRSNAISSRVHFCPSCVATILPFQSLKNDDFNELNDISIDDFIDQLNEINNVNDFVGDDPLFDNFEPSRYYRPSEIKTIFSSNSKEMTMLHVNIISIIKNFDKLKIILNSMDRTPDFIAISETRLKAFHLDSYIPQLDGYDFHRNDSGQNAGGVGAFIKSDINYEKRDDFALNVSDCQDLWFEIKPPNNKSFFVASLYRHPKQNHDQFQNNLLERIGKINDKKKEFFILGDANINLLHYSSKNKVKHYLDMLNANNCRCAIDKPTRVKSNSATLIDHIYTNVISSNIIPGIITSDISDHFPVFLKIKKTISERNVNSSRIIRDMRNFNQENYIADLQSKLQALPMINERSSMTSINDLFNKFNNVLNQTTDIHAPNRKMSRKEEKKRQCPLDYERHFKLNKGKR